MLSNKKSPLFVKTLFWNVYEALSSIKSNKLRVGLTAAIISIGISSLVGILTSIDGIQNSVSNSFSELVAKFLCSSFSPLISFTFVISNSRNVFTCLAFSSPSNA